MSLFFILAAALVAVALLFLLPGLLRKEPSDSLDQLDSNIAIAKEKQASLQQALADNAISQQAFDEEMSDVEKTLAFEASTLSNNAGTKSGGTMAAILVALFIPISAGALYLHLGEPRGINAKALNEQLIAEQQAAQSNEQAPALANLLPNLEQKLQENPDDVAGWTLLGRSYLTISEFSKATQALQKAVALKDDDPDILAMLAEATAMQAGGDLSGEPYGYLEKALQLDAQHDQSRWLMAIATQQAGDHDNAIAQFEALKLSAVGNEAAIASIDQMIARSKSVTGQSSMQSQAPANTQTPTENQAQSSAQKAETSSTEPTTTVSAPPTSSISVSVSLSDAAAADSKPDEAVFIFARASSGPPMPLAVSRHQVKDLPITVTLDDSMAMIPSMTLSTFPEVTVGARVSKSGNAIAEAGDWSIEVPGITTSESAELELIIDTQK